MPFITGTTDADNLAGSTTDDQVFGFDGNDLLAGGSGADFLHGGNGSDVLVGGAGGDALFGGAGADMFVYLTASDSSQTSGIDTLIDFETGIDRIDLRALSVTGASILQRQGGGSYLFVTTSAGQTLTLNSNQTLFAGDLLLTQAVGVHVGGTSASETLSGTVNADILYGQFGNDTLIGGAGDDILNGGLGADTLIGGAGADTFLYLGNADSNAADGFDNVADFQTGIDRIDLRNIALNQLNIVRQADGSAIVFVFVVSNQSGLVLLSGNTVNPADFLLPFDPPSGIIDAGSSAGETFVGSARTDSINGLGGNDVIFGNDGNDRLYGGNGDDVIYGGRGNDFMDGSDGNNFMPGSGARDIYAWNEYEGPARSSDGIALISGGSNRVRFDMTDIVNFTLTQGPGGTTVDVIGQGGTTLYLNLSAFVQGRDLLFFNAPTYITLVDNTSQGGVNAHTMAGSILDELIIGGANADTLTGGGGRDIFRYLQASDATPVLPDTIRDFVSGDDLLDLRALGPNIVVNLAFSGGTGFVFVDVDANGTNDMLIHLTGVSALTPNDFLFTGRFGSQPASALPEPEAAPLFDDNYSPEISLWTPLPHDGWYLTA